MKVECIAEEGYLFGRVGANEGNSMKSNYNHGLKLAKVYIVYAVKQYKGEISYLIYNENQMSSWMFADLFKIVDNSIPISWRFNYFGYQPDGISFIIGYKEIVESTNHYEGLAERTKKESELFWERKCEIDRLYLDD